MSDTHFLADSQRTRSRRSPAGSRRTGETPRRIDGKSTPAEAIKAEARRIGFDLVGIAPAVSPAGFEKLQSWLQRGFAGEMEYIPRRESAYAHPAAVMPAVRSVIMLGISYRTAEPNRPEGRMEGGGWRIEDGGLKEKQADSDSPSSIFHFPSSTSTPPAPALVSRYAWGEVDYHDVVRGRLRELAECVRALRPGARTRGVVDTAPLLERDFARLAGLGWFGKNTMLINKRLGSWLFLAALLVDVELDYDAPHETAHCGTCTRCLDACPTGAFPEPYVLDARRCISYLTIELRGPIPSELREGMGNWLFGCDVCQDVCPWNRKPPPNGDDAFRPADDLNPADAIELLGLNEEHFGQRFSKTALSRPGRAGLLRNAAIVLGNQRDAAAIPALSKSLDDVEPLVRGAAAWALGKLRDPRALQALQSRIDVEDNIEVRDELCDAVAQIEAD